MNIEVINLDLTDLGLSERSHLRPVPDQRGSYMVSEWLGPKVWTKYFWTLIIIS